MLQQYITTSPIMGKAELKQEYIRGYIQGVLDTQNGEQNALERISQLLLK